MSRLSRRSSRMVMVEWGRGEYKDDGKGGSEEIHQRRRMRKSRMSRRVRRGEKNKEYTEEKQYKERREDKE